MKQKEVDRLESTIAVLKDKCEVYACAQPKIENQLTDLLSEIKDESGETLVSTDVFEVIFFCGLFLFVFIDLMFLFLIFRSACSFRSSG